MKTFINKDKAKTLGVGLVKSVAMPLHMAGQLSTNVMQLLTDGVAIGEGYLVSKIDKEQSADVVASQRVEYTKAKFISTAMALEVAKHRLQQSIEDNKRKAGEAFDKLKDSVSGKDNSVSNIAEMNSHDTELSNARGWRVKANIAE